MRRDKNFIAQAFLGACFAVATSCTHIVGVKVDQAVVSRLSVGQTQDEAYALLGRPPYVKVSLPGDRIAWIYAYSEVRGSCPDTGGCVPTPSIISRGYVSVVFDSSDRIVDIVHQAY